MLFLIPPLTHIGNSWNQIVVFRMRVPCFNCCVTVNVHWQAPVCAKCGSSCRQSYWEVRPWPDALSCTGWTFLNVFSINLQRPSTGVFTAGRPSTSWTAAHLLQISPPVSVYALSVATSSSFHDIIAPRSVVGHSLLSAQWPGTLCLVISVTQSFVMTSLEQHWWHTFLQVSEHVVHYRRPV